MDSILKDGKIPQLKKLKITGPLYTHAIAC